MATYRHRSYAVEVGFAIGYPPAGAVDPESFRHAREEAEKELEERREFEKEMRKFFESLSLPESEEDGRKREIVRCVRVSGGLLPRPKTMPWRAWKLNLEAQAY